jgi:hypothetical protein
MKLNVCLWKNVRGRDITNRWAMCNKLGRNLPAKRPFFYIRALIDGVGENTFIILRVKWGETS